METVESTFLAPTLMRGLVAGTVLQNVTQRHRLQFDLLGFGMHSNCPRINLLPFGLPGYTGDILVRCILVAADEGVAPAVLHLQHPCV